MIGLGLSLPQVAARRLAGVVAPALAWPQEANRKISFLPSGLSAGTNNAAFAGGTWTDDKSGQVARANVTTQPTYVPGLVNGLPGLRTTANGQYLAFDDSTLMRSIGAGSTGYTIAVLFKANAGTSGQVGSLIGQTSVGSLNLLSVNAGSTTYQYSFGTNAGTQSQIPLTFVNQADWQVLILHMDPIAANPRRGVRMWLNGTCYVSKTTTTLATDAGATWRLLGGSDQTASTFRGDIGAVQVWDKWLTPAECIRVTRKLLTLAGVATMPWEAKPKYLVGFGDSITAGTGSTPTAATGWLPMLATSLGYPAGTWSNFGRPGASADDLAIYAPQEFADLSVELGRPVRVIINEWFNQQRTNTALPIASTRQMMANILTADPTIKMSHWPAIGTGTQFQTNESSRQAYIAEFTNNPGANVVNVIPIHQAPNVGGPTVTASYFSEASPGETHPNNAGYLEMRDFFLPYAQALLAA